MKRVFLVAGISLAVLFWLLCPLEPERRWLWEAHSVDDFTYLLSLTWPGQILAGIVIVLVFTIGMFVLMIFVMPVYVLLEKKVVSKKRPRMVSRSLPEKGEAKLGEKASLGFVGELPRVTVDLALEAPEFSIVLDHSLDGVLRFCIAHCLSVVRAFIQNDVRAVVCIMSREWP
jgi:hypothetical protein